MRPFFLRIYRKGKRNNNKDHKNKQDKARGQENKTKSRKVGKAGSQTGEQDESRTRGQEKKRKAKHAASL